MFAVLALTASACTIHRHYHQAPAAAYQTADEPAADSEGAPGQYRGDDQPIPPEYAKPAPYTRGYDYDDRYERRYDNGYERYDRYEQRCDCEHRQIRRPAIRRSAPAYPRHPGPVVPDNPVDWLE